MYTKIGSKASAGFTLLELVVVMAIVGILAASVLPSLSEHMQRAKVAATIKDGLCLQAALQSFAAKYPEAPAPARMTTYDEIATFGRENGCYLAARSEVIYRRRPWEPSGWYFCYRIHQGRIHSVPCTPSSYPWPPLEIPSLDPATGAELVLTVSGVPPEVPGSAVLVSPDRGVLALTRQQAAQLAAEMES